MTNQQSEERACAKCGDLTALPSGVCPRCGHRTPAPSEEPKCIRIVRDMGAGREPCDLPATAPVHLRPDDKGGHPFETHADEPKPHADDCAHNDVPKWYHGKPDCDCGAVPPRPVEPKDAVKDERNWCAVDGCFVEPPHDGPHRDANGNTTALLPCPFCPDGGCVLTYPTGDFDRSVGCFRCGANIGSGCTVDNIAAWNARRSTPLLNVKKAAERIAKRLSPYYTVSTDVIANELSAILEGQ